MAFAAPQPSVDYVPTSIALGSGDPASMDPRDRSVTPEVDLSTGTLDGTQPFQAVSAEKTENEASLLENNEKAIKAVVALADPGAVVAKKTGSSRYFIQPTSGKNWGTLHAHNAIDIANSCGTPVLAAAAGTVVSDSRLGAGSSGWNGGFGRFILLKHSNGTKTRYAHLSKIKVAVGEKVEQGQEIGNIGNTGNVEGRTGCHLHFEVIGGANPFAFK